ncbi:MAG: ABC transporter permease [Candidatus Eremiobacteraeota bacterium]|nr:ABC transporter permease [Candidatus Eremiobacteraeota bacterium]
MAATVSRPPAARLAKVAAIFRRDALVAWSYPGNFALSWMGLVIEVIIAWYISQLVPASTKFSPTGAVAVGYFQYIAINSAFVRFQSAALNSFAESIRDAQLTGTLEIVLATPTRLTTLVLSSAAWSFTYTTLQTAVFLAIAVLFGLNLTHVDYVTTLVFLALTVAAVSPLGVLAAALSMVIKKTGPIEWLSVSSAALFGGLYLPLRYLPHWLQVVGWTLPITHALNGFRAAAAGVPLRAAAPDAIWLLVASLVLMPLSLWVFAKAVGKARVDGTLSMY